MLLHQLERKVEYVCSDVDGYDAMMALGLWWKCRMIKASDNVPQKIFTWYQCSDFLKLLNQATGLWSPFVCPTSSGASSLLPFISLSSQEFFLVYISLQKPFYSTNRKLKSVPDVFNSHIYWLIKSHLQ